MLNQKKIFFFSSNKDKINEVKKLFGKKSIDLLSLEDMPDLKEPKEVGKTFHENSKIKSVYGFEKFGYPCFADDSGLCIEALNYKPGVKSKRFIKGFKDKNECFKYILKEVENSGKNNAYFQTSICLTTTKGYNIFFDGKVKGIISEKILGKGGFGYDPIFIPNGYTKTFSLMSTLEKNTISHRSIAINKLIGFLTN